MPRSLVRAALLASAATLALAACGDDGGSPATTGATTATAATGGASGAGTPTIPPASQVSGAATGAAPTTAAPTTTAAGPLVEVVYKGGKVVQGGGRAQVAKGQTVTLRVTADIVDEVHLHGYDKAVDTVAGQPVDIVFKADAAGVFEVELEKKGLKLVEIEVK